ncbi:MAG: hypothetical protein KDA99_16350, partial [Planctomycetales bacterium]|nr:hypothetical protein [Planctomycetales bacterium]
MNTSDKADQPRWEAIPAMLRARVRRYVLWEGLGLTIAWLGVWFWGGLALDYLPVLVGAGEMPAWARSVVLTCLVAGGVVIVYRSILRRVFARIPDTSMALLIERHYPDFAESLVTSVELGPGQRSSTEGVAPLTSQMLATTQQQAAALVPKVDLNRVFNKRPLVQSITLAALFVIATLAFAVTLPASFSLWSQRLFVLSSRTWPRRAAIEVLGFADNRQLKIAEGSDYTLRVRADAQRPTPPPNYCTIYYRTDAGERGRVKMTKKGGTSDGFQYYTYDGKPFKGILSPVQFDVVGFDHRVSDYRLISVASPTVVDVKIDVTPPGYTGLLPRTVAYSPGLRVPAGSQLSVTMASNKDLAQAGVAEVSIADAPPTFITNSVDDASPRSIWLEVVRVTQDLILEVTLVDQDGIRGIR